MEDLFSTLFAHELGSEWLHAPKYENSSVVGPPDLDATDWKQQETPATCAVVSQGMILHEFGVQTTEAGLMYEALSHGWFDVGGTATENLGALLNLHGVHTHTAFGADATALARELSQGHKVIAAVNGEELWGEGGLFAGASGPSAADHAIVITGVNLTDPAHPTVTINDPGDPDGAGRVYPLDQFLHAWSGSGQTYVATDAAPADLAAHADFGAHFHPETGMYMDTHWWDDFLKRTVGTVAEAAVGTLIEATIQQLSTGSVETLDDAGRNSLFLEV